MKNKMTPEIYEKYIAGFDRDVKDKLNQIAEFVRNTSDNETAQKIINMMSKKSVDTINNAKDLDPVVAALVISDAASATAIKIAIACIDGVEERHKEKCSNEDTMKQRILDLDEEVKSYRKENIK